MMKTLVSVSAALLVSQSVIAKDIKIDGQLNEVQWHNATAYHDFFKVVPATLEVTQNKVQGLVFTTEEGIYIGFKNFQKEGDRKKQYNLQDGFMQADFNRFVIDFSGDGSGAYQFSATLGGGIQDAVLTPQLTTDFDWDGVWQSAFYEYPDYWTNEIFIPWQTVSFRPNRDEQDLASVGVSLQLYELAKNHIYGSQQQTTGKSDFYLNMPKVLAQIPTSQQWSFVPYITSEQNFIADDNNVDIGFDLIYKPDHHQKLSVAVNPDFGQVDSDELVVNYSTVETLTTDKRAFFTQDIGVLNVTAEQNTRLIHTRRIGAGSDDGTEQITPIDAAGRFIHQGEHWQFAGFAVHEDDLESDAGKEFYVGRARFRQDNWQSGLLVTQTERPWLAREAKTAAFDSQYQSETWSLQSALLFSDIQQGKVDYGTQEIDQQGYGLSANVKYQFNPNVSFAGDYLRLDDQFENNDLGYKQRNNWRVTELNYNHAVNYSDGFINQVKHSIDTSYQSTDNGLKLPALQAYTASFILDNGATASASLKYFTSGWDDLIGRGVGLYQSNSTLSSRLFYGSPYTGEFSWAASFQLDEEGIDGLAQQYAVDMTWMPHHNWSVKFNQFYRIGDGLVIGTDPDQVTQFDRKFYVSYLNAAGLITDNLELSFIFQWVILDAKTDSVYDISQNQLNKQVGIDNSFTDQRFTSQIKLRYKLGAYSDIYLVYNRGGASFDDDVGSHKWLRNLNTLWQERDQDQLTFKVRYLF
ncbi:MULTISPECIES: DUF5916 domain-containing protein [Pseudoalteromonas]|uniref:DUF5916 domain-containing protein n=1 Tax=Pseudoalteromonas TaxID=53246 RepID=UPI000B083503|nr:MULTISPECIES: DUF5916 domain-containing protein [Pseudoalteromonas]